MSPYQRPVKGGTVATSSTSEASRTKRQKYAMIINYTTFLAVIGSVCEVSFLKISRFIVSNEEMLNDVYKRTDTEQRAVETRSGCRKSLDLG